MFYKGFKIVNLSKIASNYYDCKYLITINNDIVNFANTIKECKELINEYLYSLDVSEGLEI